MSDKEEVNAEAFRRLEGRVSRLERENDELTRRYEAFRVVAAESNKKRPIFLKERKTPVRKFVDFDNEEMQLVIDLITKLMMHSPTSIPVDGRDRASKIVNRFCSILSKWENEAYDNGEFF